MQGDHSFEKYSFGPGDVLNSLAWDGFRQKTDEVAGMPCFECDSDFTVRFESADARAVSRAWIDDDEWPTCRI